MSITRVQYRERQRLTAADLRAEQEHRLGMGGRHHLTHHGSGVVCGLRAVHQDGAGWVLTPGVAIDRYGREIVVPGPQPLPLAEPAAPAFVLLYYCDAPEQAPAGRRCEARPAPRTAQTFRIVLAGDFQQPADAPPPLDRASAAGPAVGQPSAPVLVVRIGASSADYSQTRYVGHRAALLTTPTGRAALQLGLAGHTDLFHLLLSTVDAGQVLQRRVGIDRDGAVHIWQALRISGAKAAGWLDVSADQRVKVSTAMPAGLDTRVLLQGDTSNGELLLSLVDAGLRPPERIDGRLPATAAAPLSVLLGSTRRVSFDLAGKAIDAAKELPAAMGSAQPAPPETTHTVPLPEQFSLELRPIGGVLMMRNPPIPSSTAAAAECGDVERFRSERDEPNGSVAVCFSPGIAANGRPLLREFGAVSTSKPSDPVPRSELRISGGGADDSDRSARVAFGGQRVGGRWIPAMTMNGKSGIVLPIGKASTLKVDGAIHLPPIGRDDPLLPDLMAKAYTHGLRQMGRMASQVTLELSDLPPMIVRGADLGYKVKVTVNGGVTVDVKRCLELISGAPRDGATTTIRTLSVFPAQIGPASITRTVSYPDFRTQASRVRIEVELLLGIGGRPFVAIAQSAEIEVRDPDDPDDPA